MPRIKRENSMLQGQQILNFARGLIIPELQIIPPELFERAQEQLKSRSTGYSGERLAPMKAEGQTLLSGNVFCRHCGARLFGSTVRKSNHPLSSGKVPGRTPVYKCSTRAHHSKDCSGPTSYRAYKIDQAVDAVVGQTLASIQEQDPSEYVLKQRAKTLKAISAQIRKDSDSYESKQNELHKLSEYIIDALEEKLPFTAEADESGQK